MRQRFTLAHELGHILIPWHIGTIACHTGVDDEDGEWIYGLTEAEANRFASELLMPSEWLETIATSGQPMPAILAAVEQANVSAPAGALALTSVLPPGHLLIIDSDGEAEYVFASPGTRAVKPRPGRRVDVGAFDRAAAEGAVLHFGSRRILWWWFGSSDELIEADDTRDSRQILRDILNDVTSSEAELRKLTHRVNGVVGSANNPAVARPAPEFHALLRQRFLARPYLGAVMGHSDFDLYVSRKAEELAARWRSQ